MYKPVSKHNLVMEANNKPARLATSVCLSGRSLKSEEYAKVAKGHSICKKAFL